MMAAVAAAAAAAAAAATGYRSAHMKEEATAAAVDAMEVHLQSLASPVIPRRSPGVRWAPRDLETELAVAEVAAVAAALPLSQAPPLSQGLG